MNPNQNRLIHELSPYLLQHANNPVNWYPWGGEAFERAQSENKPIFLSIGYSTCHWCHVMAEESFEDEEVANLLNEHYISIKVDREERPDIDNVYMKVCQLMSGQGGWPLTVIMTPDKIPFYTGTYFPKDSKYGLPGITEILTQLHIKYTEDPAHISEVTESVQHALKQTKHSKSKHRINNTAIKTTYKKLRKSFDTKFGGFGQAPKFPQPQNLLFLLDYYYFYKEEAALQMVESTLQQMVKGGIFDQIGYGFSRYSTDEAWLVPHFEKMLYDNALLLYVFSNCYHITKKSIYKQISEQIIDFISREMSSEEGAFYSAIDADSDGVEGKYYLWDYEEVIDILGEEMGEEFAEYYGMTPTGNFDGKNIPHLIHHHEKKISDSIQTAREKLLLAREKRVYPHVDDKVLTGWNCMMIAALTKAGTVFSNRSYIQKAQHAMRFIEKNLYKNGRLLASYRNGEANIHAYIDDYAFQIWALIELYEATYDISHLLKAKKQTNKMIQLFWDNEQGGFYQTGIDSEQLISRDKEIYDGALPSGNGLAVNILIKLSALTGELHYRDLLETMRYSFYEDIHEQCEAATFFMKSLFISEKTSTEVVVIGDKTDPLRQQFLVEMKALYLPHVRLLVAEDASDFSEIAPFATAYKRMHNKTTIYVCENFTCKAPTNDPDIALNNIK